MAPVTLDNRLGPKGNRDSAPVVHPVAEQKVSLNQA